MEHEELRPQSISGQSLCKLSTTTHILNLYLIERRSHVPSKCLDLGGHTVLFDGVIEAEGRTTVAHAVLPTGLFQNEELRGYLFVGIEKFTIQSGRGIRIVHDGTR